MAISVCESVFTVYKRPYDISNFIEKTEPSTHRAAREQVTPPKPPAAAKTTLDRASDDILLPAKPASASP
jgi:hypothetical protein